MGLKILIGRDGKPRETWYGRISVRGCLRTTNLNVTIAGRIPFDDAGNVRLTDKGDVAFERSRKAAQKAFEIWRKECQKDPAELQRKAHKARTGEDLEGLPLAKLYENWSNVSRAKAPTPDWCAMVKGWFADFAAFAQAEARKHRQRCENVNDVTPEIATAWFNDILARFAWETVLKMKHLISGTFTRLQGLGLARINPFGNMQLRGGGKGENMKIPHKALTAAETERLMNLARGSAMYELVVCAVCTGMRIGDCCRLKWADVDLKAGLIDCVTAKANVRVTIPIFGRLMDVLTEQAAVPGDGTAPSPFVFPEWAANYNRVNAKGHHTTRNKIIQAVKPLFARAVMGNVKPTATDVNADGSTVCPLVDVIGTRGFTEYKRNRLLDVYARHKAGERNISIARALGVARSQVCMDLREIGKLTGESLRPFADMRKQRATRLDLIESTRQERGIGQRAASLYGWHSCRHGFVVLALNAGVPVEDVRRIVGHGDVETTLDYYYNPERRHAAERMRERMSGTVLDGKGGKRRKTIGAIVDVPADGTALVPVGDKMAAVRALALARAVIRPDQAATMTAVIRAAGVDADAEPERALALIAATVDADTKAKIAAVIRAAGA